MNATENANALEKGSSENASVTAIVPWIEAKGKETETDSPTDVTLKGSNQKGESNLPRLEEAIGLDHLIISVPPWHMHIIRLNCLLILLQPV